MPAKMAKTPMGVLKDSSMIGRVTLPVATGMRIAIVRKMMPRFSPCASMVENHSVKPSILRSNRNAAAHTTEYTWPKKLMTNTASSVK